MANEINYSTALGQNMLKLGFEMDENNGFETPEITIGLHGDPFADFTLHEHMAPTFQAWSTMMAEAMELAGTDEEAAQRLVLAFYAKLDPIEVRVAPGEVLVTVTYPVVDKSGQQQGLPPRWTLRSPIADAGPIEGGIAFVQLFHTVIR